MNAGPFACQQETKKTTRVGSTHPAHEVRPHRWRPPASESGSTAWKKHPQRSRGSRARKRRVAEMSRGTDVLKLRHSVAKLDSAPMSHNHQRFFFGGSGAVLSDTLQLQRPRLQIVPRFGRARRCESQYACLVRWSAPAISISVTPIARVLVFFAPSLAGHCEKRRARWLRDSSSRVITVSYARGAIAQLGERLHGMQEVGGSIPPGSTTRQIPTSPSSRGLGHRPFTAVTGVRIPLGTPSRPVSAPACLAGSASESQSRNTLRLTRACCVRVGSCLAFARAPKRNGRLRWVPRAGRSVTRQGRASGQRLRRAVAELDAEAREKSSASIIAPSSGLVS